MRRLITDNTEVDMDIPIEFTGQTVIYKAKAGATLADAMRWAMRQEVILRNVDIWWLLVVKYARKSYAVHADYLSLRRINPELSQIPLRNGVKVVMKELSKPM